MLEIKEPTTLIELHTKAAKDFILRAVTYRLRLEDIKTKLFDLNANSCQEIAESLFGNEIGLGAEQIKIREALRKINLGNIFFEQSWQFFRTLKDKFTSQEDINKSDLIRLTELVTRAYDFLERLYTQKTRQSFIAKEMDELDKDYRHAQINLDQYELKIIDSFRARLLRGIERLSAD